MAEVTHGVSRFVKMHPSISDVYRLFSAFLGIVRPLIHSHPDPLLFQPTPSALTQGNTSSNMTNMATQYPTARMDHTIGSNLAQQGTTDLPDQAVGGQDGQIVPGDEDLWDLIDSQPWLGWMRSDALTENPTSS